MVNLKTGHIRPINIDLLTLNRSGRCLILQSLGSAVLEIPATISN